MNLSDVTRQEALTIILLRIYHEGKNDAVQRSLGLETIPYLDEMLGGVKALRELERCPTSGYLNGEMHRAYILASTVLEFIDKSKEMSAGKNEKAPAEPTLDTMLRDLSRALCPAVAAKSSSVPSPHLKYVRADRVLADIADLLKANIALKPETLQMLFEAARVFPVISHYAAREMLKTPDLYGSNLPNLNAYVSRMEKIEREAVFCIALLKERIRCGCTNADCSKHGAFYDFDDNFERVRRGEQPRAVISPETKS